MRKALIAGIVASALFAVGAFAAAIGTVTTDNVASGEGDVGSCATTAEVDFTTSPTAITNTSTADFAISTAEVRFLDGTAVATGCAGADVDLAFGTNAAGSGEPTAWIDASCTDVGTTTAGQSTCTPGSQVLARPVVEVAVLVNGNAIATDITG